MNKRAVHIILIIISFLLFGCAPASTYLITDNYKHSHKMVDIISGISKTPLRARFNPFEGGVVGQFGLIGAAIEGSIKQKSREKGLKISTYAKKNIDNINLNNLLLTNISNKLTLTNWLSPASISSPEKNTPIQHKIQQSNANLLMSIDSDFSFSPDLREFNITSLVNIYDINQSKASDSPISIYRNTLHYLSTQLAEPIKTQQIIDAQIRKATEKYEQAMKKKPRLTKKNKLKENFKYHIKSAKSPYRKDEKKDILQRIWLANNASLLEKTINEGVEQIAHLLVHDISDPIDIEKYKHKPYIKVMKDNNRKVYRIVRFYMDYMPGEFYIPYKPGELVSVSPNEKLRKRIGE